MLDDVLATQKIAAAMEHFKPEYEIGFEGRLLMTRDDFEEPCCPHDGTLVYATVEISRIAGEDVLALSVYTSRPQHNAHLVVPRHFPNRDHHRKTLSKILAGFGHRQPSRREMEDHAFQHGYEYIWK